MGKRLIRFDEGAGVLRGDTLLFYAPHNIDMQLSYTVNLLRGGAPFVQVCFIYKTEKENAF